ncbi:DUF1573 domain-containing protein [Lentisphaerota bacterium WC36G]|nr:DUF1573 domain-containing protein [Lentisphaerae bacterium WC36]
MSNMFFPLFSLAFISNFSPANFYNQQKVNNIIKVQSSTENDFVEGHFLLQNKTNKPFKISNVLKSCNSCLEIIYPKKYILPQEFFIIKVIYKINNESGDFIRVVRLVTTNTKYYDLKMEINIASLFKNKPDLIEWKLPLKTIEKESILNLKDKNKRIVQVDSAGNNFEINLKHTNEGYILELAPKSTKKRINSRIYILVKDIESKKESFEFIKVKI